VHVEAGLRSYERAMPEEINRQLIGVLAELHCAPTQLAAAQLRQEGVDASRVIVTGNTVVEATLETRPDEPTRARLLDAYGLTADGYVLTTIHRPENTDDVARLATILLALIGLDLPVILPVHPRTLTCANSFGFGPLLSRLRTVEPFDHPTFLGLAQHARLLVSDSGGVQEECTVLKAPLIVLRNSTERPEAVEAGFARRVVPGPGLPATLRAAVADTAWRARLTTTPSPYGDGTASHHITRAVERLLDYAGERIA
jgi:UDP-N-acetylglucosamine 2-epimerase (non-hydrolysing)